MGVGRRQRALLNLLMQQWNGRRSIVGDTKGPVTCPAPDRVFVSCRGGRRGRRRCRGGGRGDAKGKDGRGGRALVREVLRIM